MFKQSAQQQGVTALIEVPVGQEQRSFFRGANEQIAGVVVVEARALAK